MLLAAVTTGCGEGRRMMAMLEDARHRNSNSMELPAEDTLQMLVDYFSSHGSANERMQAIYVMGCMYQDRGDAPQALNLYHDAIAAADTTNNDCDFKTLSRVYGQMGNIFMDMRSPKLAIEVMQKAYNMANRAQDSLNASISFLYISNGYFLLGKNDSALYFSHYAAKKMREYGAYDMAATASAIDYTIYLRQGKYKDAKTALDKYEKESGYVDAKGNITPGRERFYISKGNYYNGIGNSDSALYFYRKFLSLRHDITGMEDAYRGIMSVYRNLNVTDSVAKYSILFAQANDSANVLKSSEEITRLQTVYNYNDIQRVAMQKTAEAHERQLWLYIVILSGIIVLFAAYLFYQIRQRIVRKRIKELAAHYKKDLALYLQLKNEMATLQKDHTLLQNGYSALENNMNELGKKLAEYENEKYACLVNNDSEAKQSVIVGLLHEASANDKVASKRQWIDLNNEMCEHLPLFVWKLNGTHLPLTEQEQRVCYLVRMGFNAQEIAPLMAVSRQRITNIFATINGKLFGENSAKNFLHTIQHL